MKTATPPPPPFSMDRLARLAGVTIGTSEPVPETLVFHLQTPAGGTLPLDLHTALAAIGFACRQGAIPPLPDDWIAHAISIHGVDALWS